jgi:hypothetical protein
MVTKDEIDAHHEENSGNDGSVESGLKFSVL